jgi:hypothetical protein
MQQKLQNLEYMFSGPPVQKASLKCLSLFGIIKGWNTFGTCYRDGSAVYSAQILVRPFCMYNQKLSAFALEPVELQPLTSRSTEALASWYPPR